ncbi:hypothetical protein AALO_G00114090 [Alosa alosa]|uniref:Ig-like domain-containing protein n=1 Tax=Alosa alosa TaxID=278164 RepID=A0AAV6GRQ3_9TELE|nr:hypothetical protein AALO_G00114090 [Alosa alosa]
MSSTDGAITLQSSSQTAAEELDATLSAAPKHTGLYVCRAEIGDPAYQTDYSNAERIWVVGLSPPASLVITPNRLQHFVHNSLSMSCVAQDKSGRWKLRWETGRAEGPECPQEWTSEAASTCSIRSLSSHDSGMYWCESESREYGPFQQDNNVILDIPAYPVTEGDPMTLHCIFRNSSAYSAADFYKDNSLLQSQTTGEMTITAVSKAHTGSYRCKHSVLGQSPGSWKTVISEIFFSPCLLKQLIIQQSRSEALNFTGKLWGGY